MTQVMTPSDVKRITARQIGKLQELLAARLRKGELPSDLVQQVLENQGDALVDEWLYALRRRVDALSNIIVRKVIVDGSRTPQEALDATGRRQYTTQPVVEAMPRSDEGEQEIFFFKPRPEVYNKHSKISDDVLEAEYAFHGFEPVEPDALAKVNEDDPEFADNHPNATHWKDESGRWCYAAFDRWVDYERGVGVYRHDDRHDGDYWHDGWWFAGRKRKRCSVFGH